MTLPDHVRIVEVSPRDGLQNEPKIVPLDVRVDLIERLAKAGLRRIEAGSFVSEKAVPQMAVTGRLLASVYLPAQTRLAVLTPNMRGLQAALAVGAREIGVMAAASDSFSRKNLGCGVEESLDRYVGVLAAARDAGVFARGYVSCALGCPYEGAVDSLRIVEVASRLYELGCQEISLADTIGIGTPLSARRMVEDVAQRIPLDRIAIHFHDSYGQALANIFSCLEVGVSIVDSAVGGLGGCPFAPGATGNVATEDVVYMLHGCGVDTGVDLAALLDAGEFICRQLGRKSESRVARAMRAQTLPLSPCATRAL